MINRGLNGFAKNIMIVSRRLLLGVVVRLIHFKQTYEDSRGSLK